MKNHHWFIIAVVLVVGILYVSHMRKSHKGESLNPLNIISGKG